MTEPRARFTALRDLLAGTGFRPQRKLGQNFLLDASLHRAIADTIEVSDQDVVLEVGPGLGFMTRELLARGADVVAVEIDPRLCAILRRELAPALQELPGRLTLIEGDILAGNAVLQPQALAAIAAAQDRRFVVVANLPYAITGPFLAAVPLLEPAPAALALLVQAELAERLVPQRGGGTDGALAAVLQLGYAVRIARRVGREVFRPRPNVDSAVLELRRLPAAGLWTLPAAERRRLLAFLRVLFERRRKQLRNALPHALARVGGRVPALPAAQLQLRAEQLGTEELLALYAAVAAEPPLA